MLKDKIRLIFIYLFISIIYMTDNNWFYF